MRWSDPGQAEIPSAVVPVSRVPREAEDQSTVFRAGIFLLGEEAGRLPFRNKTLQRTSVVSSSVSWKAEIASACLACD